MLCYSVYLRLFLASLHSLILQIGHYLLHSNSANLLKKLLSTKLELKSKTDSKKTEQERALETELCHHTHTLCPAAFAVLVLAFAEVVLTAYLYAWCHVPEEVECAIQSISVHCTLLLVVGEVT